VRAIQFAVLGVSVCGCESVHLRAADPPTPAEAPAPTEVLPTTAEPPTTCAATCIGGRRCVEGECLPHWLPVPSPEVAGSQGRVGHFAVWTGSEVIVWGGHDPNVAGDAGVFGDGFRFDPVRGEVRMTSRLLAPTPRFANDGQTAVWTGREMIIWGGQSGSAELSDGAAYVPSTDRWVPIAGVTAPRTRVNAVFTGTSLVLAGARGPNDAWRWEPSLGSWVQATRGPTTSDEPRRRHSAVWSGDELLVWGGVDASGVALSDGWRFSPARRKARALHGAGAPIARSDHAAVWAGDEMLVFGGRGGDGAALASPVSYVPAVDAWRELAAEGAPSPRYGHVAVWTGHSLLVWGGTDGRRPLRDGAEYDPWERTWTPLADVDVAMGSAAREGAVGVWTGRELVVIGGADGNARLSPLGWRYQP
jgi:Kelch motif